MDCSRDKPVIIDSAHASSPTVSGGEGNYRVIRLLGRGTMGSVYLAEQVSMARPVALKILSASLSADPAFIDRFLREARAAARLNHPNIVSAIDFGEFESRFFLAMEFIDGKPLSAMLAGESSLEESLVIAIGLQVIAALHHATQHNVIHLDVKPANIMICKDGRVKLTDFGLAMIVDSPKSAEASHKAVGTPYYMAPEQVEGGALDWRSDQFSLGASLYEAATGQKPFQGSNVSEILVKRFFESPPPAWKTGSKRVSRYFSAVLAKMLSRSPEGRYQSFSELEDDFNFVKDGQKPWAAKTATSALAGPATTSWHASGYAGASARVDGLLWRKRWGWIAYSCVLFLMLLGVYAYCNADALLGPRPPKHTDMYYVKLAQDVSTDKSAKLRERWSSALRLQMRAEKEPSLDNLRRALHSFRLIANNREYRDTAYAAAARERAALLEESLARLSGGREAE